MMLSEILGDSVEKTRNIQKLKNIILSCNSVL